MISRARKSLGIRHNMKSFLKIYILCLRTHVLNPCALHFELFALFGSLFYGRVQR